MTEDNNSTSTLELATELTIAWLANPNTRAAAADVPEFLERMHSAVNNLTSGSNTNDSVPEAEQFTPAVSVRKSLSSKDHIISMIDGKPYKTLRRHLAGHGLTPEQYRERYSLKADYPMVSESYSQARRDMAKKIGLGRKTGARANSAEAKAPAAPASEKPSAVKPKASAPKPAAAKPAAAKSAVAKSAAAKPAAAKPAAAKSAGAAPSVAKAASPERAATKAAPKRSPAERAAKAPAASE